MRLPAASRWGSGRRTPAGGTRAARGPGATCLVAVLAVLVSTVLSIPAVAVTPSPAPAATPAPASTKGLVVAVDVTDSVSAEQFAAAKQALVSLIRRPALADVDIGLVTFAEDAELTRPPDRDHDALVAQIEGLTIRRTNATALYDAVALSLTRVVDYDVGSVIMITDGEEFPREDLEEIEARSQAYARQAVSDDTQVSAVTIEDPDRPVPDDFVDFITATGGTPREVPDGDALVQDLRSSLDDAVGPELVPERPPVAADIDLIDPELITGSGGQGAIAAAPAPAPPTMLPRWALLVAGATTFVAALTAGLVFAGIAARAYSPPVRRQRAMADYTVIPGPPPTARQKRPTGLGDNPISRAAVQVGDVIVERAHLEDRLTRRLVAGDVPLRPGEWVVVHAACGAALGLLLLVLTLGNPLALVAGAALGGYAPALLLTFRRSRRRKAFHDALPDTLQLLASSLRVGYSLPQALDTVVREGREPVRTELDRALVDSQLGVPLEDSLEAVADRVESEDFRWVVLAVRIQREVGGNLAEILDTVGETMRERERLRRHVDTLAAEGRLSAMIVGGLPVVFVLYLLVARPGYLAPLVTERLGVLVLLTAVVLFAGGVIGLRWATRVDT